MQITEHTRDGVVVVALAGRFDSSSSPAVDAHLQALVAGANPRVVVDLSGVEYISSAGLRVMLSLAKRTKEARGRLVLAGLGDAVRQVFELAGFLPLFLVEPTGDAAVVRVSAA